MDKSGEDFWVKAEKLYYTALIGYIWYEAPDHEKNTALYERLSRDDFGKDDDQQRESTSISNQKAMLEEFAARQGFTTLSISRTRAVVVLALTVPDFWQ